MNGLDSRPTPPGRFKWGRLLSLAGAAGLCVSFFMKHVDIKGPFVPSDCLQSVNGLWLMVSFCLPFLAAILLLPLLAFRAVPRVDGAPVGKFLAVAVCAICLSVVTIGLGWLTLLFYITGSPGFSRFASEMPLIHAVTAVTAVSLVLAIVAMVRSRLPHKAAAAQFALGASCLAYFAFFAIADFTKYAGLGLSLAASGMLAIGSAIDWFQCRPARKW
jgi:hypothetical protein